MSNNANNTAISPKEFAFNAFKSKIPNAKVNGKWIAKVLKHYYSHVNYYKKNAQPTIPEKSVANQVALAESVFKTKAEDK